MTAITVSQTNIVCGSCGVPHSMPTQQYETIQREGGFWTCPNGHSRGWAIGTDAKKLAECEQEKQDMQDHIDELHVIQERVEGADLVKQSAIVGLRNTIKKLRLANKKLRTRLKAE